MATNKELDVVILAGGMGDRMGNLTQFQQKCMLMVDEKPILGHILDNLLSAFGSAHVVVATGYREESVSGAFGNKYGKLDIEYVHGPERLGTRKSVLLTENLIGNQFLYLAGDVISHPIQLVKVLESFEREKNEDFLGVISAATDHQPALSHALVTDRSNYVVEMIYPPTPTWTNGQLREMGIAFYNRKFINQLKDAHPNQLNMSHVIVGAIKQGRSFVVEKYKARWYHFACPQDLQVNLSFY